MEIPDIVQEAGSKPILKKKKCKKAKLLSEEALQIAVKWREAKGKGEKERYTHLNAEFQRIARREKMAFLSDQWTSAGSFLTGHPASTFSFSKPLCLEQPRMLYKIWGIFKTFPCLSIENKIQIFFWIMRAINNPICVHISKLTILFSSYAPNWLFFPLKKILALLLFSCELVLTDYILHLNIRFPRVGNISTYDSAYQKCMCLHGAQSSLIFVTQETVAHQSPLFIEFFRQKSWSRLPFPTPGIFLT